MATSLINATGIATGPSPTLVNMTSTLPNPFTPLAFLPPDAARQYMVFMYVLVGVVSVLIWDILCHLKDDYRLITRHRITLPTVVYFVARLFNVLYLVGFLVINTAPIGHCTVVTLVVQSLFAIAVPASELLFFLHVRAVYINNRPAVCIFTFLWLCTIASSVIPVFSVTSMPIGPSQYCLTNSSLPLYDTVSAIVPLVNDSVLFGALAFRMLRSSYQERTLKGDIRAMMFGDHIPLVSRALLHNGQAYFLSTVSLNLAEVSLYLIIPLPTAYRSILTLPSVLLMNIMSSRIYRNTKFGYFDSSATLPTLPTFSSSIAHRHESDYTNARTTMVPQVSVVTTQSLFRDTQSVADDEGTLSCAEHSNKELDLEASR